MTSPSSATVPFTTSFRFPPHIVLLIFAALIYGASALQQPTMTFCSGQSPYFASSPAITSGELASFLDAVCAGAYGAAHRSHSMSASVAGTNRTMYGVAECLPDVPVPDCAACLAAASARLIAWRTSCAASAVWHDACFLRFSDSDPVLFHEDEYTATVFNASRGGPSLLPREDGGKAVVRRLLVAAGNSTVSSHTCRGVGASSAADDGHVYGLTRCAAGMSCADCRRCLRGALAAVEREYNGSAGMQVLRLNCMARYESYPFYKATPRQLAANIHFTLNRTSNGTITVNTPDAKFPPPPPPTVLDPFAISPPPPVAQSAPTNPTGAGPTAQPQDTPPPGKTSAAYMQQSHGKTPKMLMLTVPITTGLVVVSVILGLIIWYRRKQPLPARRGHAIDGTRGENMHGQGEEQWSTEEEDEDGRRTSCCQLYSYQVLEAATGHFSKSNKLGSGGFGTVFRGTLENGKQVAVKRLRDSKRSIHELDREISIVSDLRHKNLVRFLGYCFQEEGKFLIYEYVPNNSLEKFWHKARHQSQKLEWATWFNIIKGVARGLQFLHNKGILHRDLKPHNVLLDENFNPKIADFDLMRIYDKQRTHESTEKVAGTFGYMAPECTTGRKFLLSVKSDVYSYGVLVLEIITGHKIYTFEGQNSEGLVEYVWHHWTEKRVGDIIDGDLGIVDDGQEEHAARHQALRCVHIALLCVQSDRSRRPTMGQVIAMLSSDEGMEDLQEPSLPGYVVFRPTAASGPVRLPCLGCR